MTTSGFSGVEPASNHPKAVIISCYNKVLLNRLLGDRLAVCSTRAELIRSPCSPRQQLQQAKAWKGDVLAEMFTVPHTGSGTCGAAAHWSLDRSHWIRKEYSTPGVRIFVSLVPKRERNRDHKAVSWIHSVMRRDCSMTFFSLNVAWDLLYF